MPIIPRIELLQAQENVLNLFKIYAMRYSMAMASDNDINHSIRHIKPIKTTSEPKQDALIDLFNEFVLLMNRSEIIKSFDLERLNIAGPKLLRSKQDLVDKIALLFSQTDLADAALFFIQQPAGKVVLFYLLVTDAMENVAVAIDNQSHQIINDYLQQNQDYFSPSLKHALSQLMPNFSNFKNSEYFSIDDLTLVHQSKPVNFSQVLTERYAKERLDFMNSLPLFMKVLLKKKFHMQIWQWLSQNSIERASFELYLSAMSASSLSFHHEIDDLAPFDKANFFGLFELESIIEAISNNFIFVNISQSLVAREENLVLKTLLSYLLYPIDHDLNKSLLNQLALPMALATDWLIHKGNKAFDIPDEKLIYIVQNIQNAHYQFCQTYPEQYATSYVNNLAHNTFYIIHKLIDHYCIQRLAESMALFIHYREAAQNKVPSTEKDGYYFLYGYFNTLSIMENMSVRILERSISFIDAITLIKNHLKIYTKPNNADLKGLLNKYPKLIETIIARTNIIASNLTNNGNLCLQNPTLSFNLCAIHNVIKQGLEYFGASTEDIAQLASNFALAHMNDVNMEELASFDVEQEKLRASYKKDKKKKKKSPKAVDNLFEKMQPLNHQKMTAPLVSQASSFSFFSSKTIQATEPTIVYRSSLPYVVNCFIKAIQDLDYKNLFLVGGSVTDLLMNRTIENIHDFDFVLLDVDLNCLKTVLESDLLEPLQNLNITANVIGIAHQILSITLKIPNSHEIKIDISTYPKTKYVVSENIRDYLAEADFEFSSFYIECTDSDSYIISPCQIAKTVTPPTQIELLSTDPRFFEQKPLSILRLVKLCLKYPDLPLSENLIIITEHLKNHSPFTEALKIPGHAARFSTTITQLFERFGFQQTISKMNEFNLLSHLTGFSNHEIIQLIEITQDFIQLANNYEQQKAFFFYSLTSYHLYTSAEGCHLREWIFYKVAQQLPKEYRSFYEYLLQKIKGIESQTFFPPFVELDQVLENIKNLSELEADNTASFRKQQLTF